MKLKNLEIRKKLDGTIDELELGDLLKYFEGCTIKQYDSKGFYSENKKVDEIDFSSGNDMPNIYKQ